MKETRMKLGIGVVLSTAAICVLGCRGNGGTVGDGASSDTGDTDADADTDADGDTDTDADTDTDSDGDTDTDIDGDTDADGDADGDADCATDGDGKTTLVFVNGCKSPVTFAGSDIEGETVPSGRSVCRDIGTADEPLSSKRYWGYKGVDPGGEHHTLAEFTFNTDFYDFDWYNISHVDAHNLPMAIRPLERTDCPALSCPDDLLPDCPEEGRYLIDGELVACVSPDRDNPDSPVARYFDEGCSDAYAWSKDDAESMAACAGEDFEIVFCPEGEASASSLGGTMTFTEVGAPGDWPRRLDLPEGDPACTYKDGTDTWGGHCCMTLHDVESDRLSPFNEEMTLILKAIEVSTLAVYQPETAEDGADWERVSRWSGPDGATNFHFTKSGDDDAPFDGDLTRDDCVWYVMQEPSLDCDTFDDYFCPNDPGINHLGWSGSKLIVFDGSMTFDDANVKACDGDGAGHPGPWVAFVASELIRDGGRKWNGLCNCYSKTDSVGDGCGEINVFEVVMDNNEWSNREFISTGVRSFQAGHVGGNVCGSGCKRDDVADNVDLVDACTHTAFATGAELPVGGDRAGCPVWRRPEGRRFFMILLDETTRTIQVALLPPDNLPAAATPLLPSFPAAISRETIDQLIALRLPK